MFTIAQIKAAHSKVKSGADFPNYVKELKALDVLSYVTYVNDGHTLFCGTDDNHQVSEAKYETLYIADKSNAQLFTQQLKAHQQGLTDYLTFCNMCASTGVEKWIVDAIEMTCTYYSKSGEKILIEEIPQV